MSKPEMEILSDTIFWIKFKEHEIRIEQDEKHTDGKLMITVHKEEDADYHAKLLVEKENESWRKDTVWEKKKEND
jgi:hypothetical protein